MAYGNLAFLPDAVAAIVQDGILERKLYESLKPALRWRAMFFGMGRIFHPGNIGDRVTSTRVGLITPAVRATAKLNPGQDPGTVTTSIEQYSYQIQPYGNSLPIFVPSGYLATGESPQEKVLKDINTLAFHGAHSIDRWARDSVLDAYEGGDTFATGSGSSSTSVAVADARGFGTVLVNGVPTAVSSGNPLTATLGSTSVSITAVAFTSGTSGPGTITLASAATWSAYDRLLASNAPKIIRVNSRTTDRAIVSGDTVTMQTVLKARSVLINNNVPGIDGVVGGVYGIMLDADMMQTLMTDTEFYVAVQGQGITGPFLDGAIVQWKGLRFYEVPRTELQGINQTDVSSAYQTDIHKLVVFGGDVGVEACIPEQAFGQAVPMAGVVDMNHLKMALDPALTLVIRGPIDALGRTVVASWVFNGDWQIPSDVNNLAGNARFKRVCVVHAAGPAFT